MYGMIASFMVVIVIIFIIGVGCLRVDKHFLPFIIEVAVSGSILLLALVIVIIVVITKQIQSCCERPPPPPIAP
jgi:hypothetical protein